MKTSSFDRRRFLRKLGVGVVGGPVLAYLPWLEAAAEAQGRGAPQRIIFFLHANGVYHGDWKPSGGASAGPDSGDLSKASDSCPTHPPAATWR